MRTPTLAALLLCIAAFLHADTVKIGVILPLSGNQAASGQTSMLAVKLFQKELATKTYKHKYELVIEDAQGSGRLTALAANKLLDVDRVDALLSLYCDAGWVLEPRVKKAQIPHINCVCSNDKVAEGKFNFVHWPHTDKECAAFADLIQKLGGKRVALLGMYQPGWLALFEGTKKELEKRGVTVTFAENFNAGLRDFRVTLAKAKATNPDVFIPISFSPELEIILRQMKQIDFKPIVTTVESFDFTNDLTDAEGLYYVSAGAPTAAFNRALVDATGKNSIYGVPTIYDALNLIRSAYETMDKPDHVQAAHWIAQVKDFPSAVGRISMGKQGRIDSDLGFYKIVGGKPVPVILQDVK